MNGPDALTGEQPARAGEANGEPLRAARRPARLALANWPVSVRLGALFVLASITGLVFGGLRVADAIGSSQAYARTAQLAVLAQRATSLAQDLEDERDLSSGVSAYMTLAADAAADKAAPAVADPITTALTKQKQALATAEHTTDADAAQTRTLAEQIGSAFPSSTQSRAAEVVTMIGNIPQLRQLTGQPAAAIIGNYSASIADVFSLNDEITAGSGDAQLADAVRALGALSRAKDEASQQRAFLYSALLEVSVNDAGTNKPYNNIGLQSLTDSGTSGLSTLITAQGLQSADQAVFNAAATPDQSNAYQAIMSSSQAGQVQQIENQVTQYGDPRLTFEQIGNQTSLGLPQATVAATWYQSMSGLIGQLRQIETQAMGTIVGDSQAAQHDATGLAVLTAAVTAAAVLLVLLATALVGRSLVNPLRRLRADALDIATRRLPDRVAAAAANPQEAATPAPVEPIGVQSTDEIGQVARAFDRVHAEAVRLAGTEAQLRDNVSAMFISLSRRSVPLIDRLSRTIDSMEQDEDDPEQLAKLFSIDHLVTRMRRNSENLLVLAGEEPVRKWIEAVPLADVTRAAVAEIQQYGRVAVTGQPGITVAGQAVADTVHLLAELIENATLYSPQQTRVGVNVTELTTGGVLVEVRDEGIGVSPGKLEELNFRLDNPPALDVSVSRHMGLYAVAHLAARHGIRIRLRANTPQGLSALVWLPGTIAKHEPGTGTGPLPQRGSGDPRRLTADVRGSGRHRGGLFASSGAQPLLDGTGSQQTAPVRTGSHAAAGSHAASTLPARDLPAGSHAGRPATAWFAAKRPSGGPPRPAQELAAAWQAGPGGSGGYPADGFTPPGPQGAARHNKAAPAGPGPDADERTSAGLPRRTPRTNSYPGSRAAEFDLAGVGEPADDPALSDPRVPVLSAPAGGPAIRQHQDAAAFAGGFPGAPRPEQPPARRRSAEAVRSRLAGFQLGSRDAAHAGPETPLVSPAGEDNSR